LFDPSTDEPHTPLRITPSIGTTVHFIDAELSHENGLLRTKLHRDPATIEHELRNKFAYRIHKPPTLFEAVLIDTVCCNSNEIDFHQEARYMARSYLMASFSMEALKRCIQQVDGQSGVGEKRRGPLFAPYDELRQRALEQHHQQQQALKKQRLTERENMLRITSPKTDKIDLTVVKVEEKVPRIPTYYRPLTINDYLADRKPPRYLLILQESDRNKTWTS
jgi:hypothetical protein